MCPGDSKEDERGRKLDLHSLFLHEKIDVEDLSQGFVYSFPVSWTSQCLWSLVEWGDGLPTVPVDRDLIFVTLGFRLGTPRKYTKGKGTLGYTPTLVSSVFSRQE